MAKLIVRGLPEHPDPEWLMSFDNIPIGAFFIGMVSNCPVMDNALYCKISKDIGMLLVCSPEGDNVGAITPISLHMPHECKFKRYRRVLIHHVAVAVVPLLPSKGPSEGIVVTDLAEIFETLDPEP